MAIHVYITDQCKKDIERQQYTSIITAFKDKIEKSQHSGVFDRFPPPYLKKRFERQVRLVAKECLLGEDTRKTVTVEGEAVAVDSEQCAAISRWNLTVCFANLQKGKIALQTPDGLDVTLPVAPGTNPTTQ